MDKLENVIKALELCRYDPDPDDPEAECKFMVSCEVCPYWSDNEGCQQAALFSDAIDLLKAQPQPDFSDHFLGLSEMVFVDPAPRIFTLEEIKAYLNDEDDDKNPLWVQWASSAVKGGWVMPHTVHDLVWRYEAIYNVHWALWTQKPTEEQRKAVAWNG